MKRDSYKNKMIHLDNDDRIDLMSRTKVYLAQSGWFWDRSNKIYIKNLRCGEDGTPSVYFPFIKNGQAIILKMTMSYEV